MKNFKWSFTIIIGSLLVWSCNRMNDAIFSTNNLLNTSSTTAAEMLVNELTTFKDPPIAKDFIVQQLERPDAMGNNMLFKAVFGREYVRLRGFTSFNVQVSEGVSVLLRDDGRLGDEVSGDGTFSAFVKDDPNTLINIFKEKNAVIERNNKILTVFSGRSATPTKAEFIDIDGFINKKAITVGSSIGNATVTPAVFGQLKTNSLVITDLGVVQDPTRTYNPCIGGTAGGNPNGVWTFKSLMTNMANQTLTGVSADNFVKNWVDTELFGQKIQAISLDNTTQPVRDNLTLAASPKRKLIAAWLKNSGFAVTQVNINNWNNLLVNKLEFFPVRLMAIVNRLDLRGNFGYTGGTSNAGEGRFVFSFMDSNNSCSSANNGPGTLTIIAEYGIPLSTCSSIKNYGQQWYNLKNMVLGSAAYNTALQNITDVFTKANANSSRPNGSALNHLRSNEFIMAPWNIRDHEINSASHQLTLISPNKEAMNEANANGGNIPVKVNSLVNFINTNATTVETEGNYALPSDIKAIDAQMTSPSYFWNGTGLSISSDLARHKFSLNTCSGCHAGETKNTFTHIRPTNFGTPVGLSPFMTGLGGDDDFTDNDLDPMGLFWVTDPAGRPAASPTKRGFNDILRRANDLETLVTTACSSRGPIVALAELLRFQPISAD